MNRLLTAARRAGLAGILVGLVLCGFVPADRVVSAQSGRKPPEKARKNQPESPPQEQNKDKPVLNPEGPKAPALKPEDLQNSIQLGVDVVNVETVVYEKKTGKILQGLKPENFTIFEDGVKQEITNFLPSQGPVTMVFLIEFSRRIDNYGIRKREVLDPATYFVTTFAQDKDNIAVIAFDVRPYVVHDFTSDPNKLRNGMMFLYRNNPAWSESNLYDAIKFVIEGGKVDDVDYTGLKSVEQRAAIVLISIGIDTFSKINLDQTRKIVSRAGIPIYTVGVGNLYYKLAESRMAPENRLDWEQAFNTLKSFSRMTGGKYFPITFAGEIPSTMQSIGNLLRSQYSIGYEPSNDRHEGKMRKIDVQVDIDGDGKFDEKQYEVQHRESYIEPLDAAPRK
jgi:Ca-activated chloride channel homolog